MIDFVSAFFSWGKEEIKEPIDPRIEEKPKRKKLNKIDVTEVKQEEE